uniref:MICAL-like protein 2 n=1 Tax=Cacopsylla melanoneura TaxID=428564 RepID=A0A8D8RLH5_9HEMI
MERSSNNTDDLNILNKCTTDDDKVFSVQNSIRFFDKTPSPQTKDKPTPWNHIVNEDNGKRWSYQKAIQKNYSKNNIDKEVSKEETQNRIQDKINQLKENRGKMTTSESNSKLREPNKFKRQFSNEETSSNVPHSYKSPYLDNSCKTKSLNNIAKTSLDNKSKDKQLRQSTEADNIIQAKINELKEKQLNVNNQKVSGQRKVGNVNVNNKLKTKEFEKILISNQKKNISNKFENRKSLIEADGTDTNGKVLENIVNIDKIRNNDQLHLENDSDRSPDDMGADKNFSLDKNKSIHGSLKNLTETSFLNISTTSLNEENDDDVNETDQEATKTNRTIEEIETLTHQIENITCNVNNSVNNSSEHTKTNEPDTDETSNMGAIIVDKITQHAETLESEYIAIGKTLESQFNIVTAINQSHNQYHRIEMEDAPLDGLDEDLENEKKSETNHLDSKLDKRDGSISRDNLKLDVNNSSNNGKIRGTHISNDKDKINDRENDKTLSQTILTSSAKFKNGSPLPDLIIGSVEQLNDRQNSGKLDKDSHTADIDGQKEAIVDDLNPFGDDAVDEDKDDKSLETDNSVKSIPEIVKIAPDVPLIKASSTKDIDYPEDLNPFGDDDEEEEGDVSKTSLDNSMASNSMEFSKNSIASNPFEEEDNELDKTNPFFSDLEEDEKVELKRPPVPTPRKSTATSAIVTPEPSRRLGVGRPPRASLTTPNHLRGSMTSLISTTSSVMSRKKKPAPPPPPANPTGLSMTSGGPPPVSPRTKRRPPLSPRTKHKLSAAGVVSTSTSSNQPSQHLSADSTPAGSRLASPESVRRYAPGVKSSINTSVESVISKNPFEDDEDEEPTTDAADVTNAHRNSVLPTLTPTSHPQTSTPLQSRRDSATSNVHSLSPSQSVANFGSQPSSPLQSRATIVTSHPSSPSHTRNNSSVSTTGAGFTPHKSTYGQWRRKKGHAPPVPIPQKRNIKPMSDESVKRELADIEIKQQELERQGVKLEELIRTKSLAAAAAAQKNKENTLDDGTPCPTPKDSHFADDTLSPTPKESPVVESTHTSPAHTEELVLQLFELVNEKNALLRRQAELMYMRRAHHLEEEYAELEYQIRVLMMRPDKNKTDADKEREEQLLQRLIEVVERRDEIVQTLDKDRLKEMEEDRSVSSQINIFAQDDSEPETSRLSGKDLVPDTVSMTSKKHRTLGRAIASKVIKTTSKATSSISKATTKATSTLRKSGKHNTSETALSSLDSTQNSSLTSDLNSLNSSAQGPVSPGSPSSLNSTRESTKRVDSLNSTRDSAYDDTDAMSMTSSKSTSKKGKTLGRKFLNQIKKL